MVRTVGAGYHSAKQCPEILDELFGRDRRAPDQILDQLDVLARKGARRAELGAGDEMRHQPVRHVARFHGLLGLLGRDADISDWPTEHLRELIAAAGAIYRRVLAADPEFVDQMIVAGRDREVSAAYRETG